METVSCPFTPPQSAMCQIALISDLIMAAGGNGDVCAKFQIKNFQEHHFEALEEALVSVRFQGQPATSVATESSSGRPYGRQVGPVYLQKCLNNFGTQRCCQFFPPNQSWLLL